MVRSNSGDWKMIFGTDLSILNIGLMVYGGAKCKEAEATRKDLNTVLTRHDKKFFTSELFKVIQDGIPLILHFKTMCYFRTISSSKFLTSDVQSIYISSQIQDWFRENKIQIARPIIFVGNRRWWSRWHINLLVNNFFRCHHNRFRNTISWECIVEDDCVRSCWIELQSFPLSKLDIDQVHRVLMHFPLFLARCKTWFGQIELLRIFVILIHGIHGCKEYRLSVPVWILMLQEAAKTSNESN